MKTSQQTPRTELPAPRWQAAMAEFRARAQRLFETQRDRVAFLEASIAEQLAALDQADEDSPTTAPDRSQESREASLAELEHSRTQLAQCRKLLNARASELKQLRCLLAGQADGVEGIDVETLLEQLSDIRLERDELAGRLADAQRLAEQASDVNPEQFEDLQRRFEVAVREIRELKAKNEDLQQRASRGEAGLQDTAPATTGFDWEQQKLRLMQQLDSDFDASQPNDERVKLSIESTIRITDEVIAEKDRQIAELRASLEDQAVHSPESTSSALLDDDEQIREERERLSRLEDQWREKLRQAEIDISVERAKLARERSDFEARLRSLEESASGEPAGAKTTSKQSGRWLSRLGLKDDDK